jgi:lysophospholipase L1-like esterase
MKPAKHSMILQRSKRVIGTVVSIVAMCTAIVLHAQPDALRGTSFHTIDRSAMTVVERGSGTGFATWHNKLDKLVFEGEGSLNIVHIGGSHVQADMWSMQARDNMQHLVPGVRGSRGSVFPYAMARTNNPPTYATTFMGNWTPLRNVTKADTSVLGLSGISVRTTDTLAQLAITFRTEQYAGYSFDRVKVLHRMDSSYTVEAWYGDSLVRVDREVHADSGYTLFRTDRSMDTLRLTIRRTDSLQNHFTLYGILLENSEPGIVYHAVGVNGASTSSYLRCQRFVNDLALIDPDLVIFSVGINDAHDNEFDAARFKRNYTELIARVRAASPDAAILLTTNSDSWFKRKVPNRNAFKVRTAMLELSAEQDVAVWDLFTTMGGLGSMAKWEKGGLAQKDRIHFTRPGYLLLGDLLFGALMDAYAAHLRRTNRP